MSMKPEMVAFLPCEADGDGGTLGRDNFIVTPDQLRVGDIIMVGRQFTDELPDFLTHTSGRNRLAALTRSYTGAVVGPLPEFGRSPDADKLAWLGGVGIRTTVELPGDKRVETTMIFPASSGLLDAGPAPGGNGSGRIALAYTSRFTLLSRPELPPPAASAA